MLFNLLNHSKNTLYIFVYYYKAFKLNHIVLEVYVYYLHENIIQLIKLQHNGYITLP